MIRSHDWWRTDAVCFAGARCLLDAAEQNDLKSSSRAVARLFVVDLLSAAIGPGSSAACLTDAAGYLAVAFEPGDAEGAVLGRCLDMLARGDTVDLAGLLHQGARICAAGNALQSARSLAELSYEAALACGSWQDAWAAAQVLERLAELDECPRAAERWARRAETHARRVRRQR